MYLYTKCKFCIFKKLLTKNNIMKKIIRIFMLSLMIGGFAFNISQSAVDSANVTFQVDMSNVSSSFTSPEVNGTFNSWCGCCK